MNSSASASGASSASSQRAARPAKQPRNGQAKRPRRASTLGKTSSAEANRRAALILEVLAGQRLPSEAAAALGVSVTHYYLLERKALEGLLAACEHKPKGPSGPTPQQQVARLQRELQQCQRQCQRQAALVRTTQRALGLSPAPSSVASPKTSSRRKKGTSSSRKRRRRRPTVRALRAAEALQKNSSLSNRPDELKQLPVDASTGCSLPAQQERRDG